ncbi:MAG: OmpA family protein [Magnetococcales bacterium]|nr:OmpA family protein [Magnetococcales bacterium]
MAAPPKKCPPCKKGTPLWMVSWADMVTLLMCFFIIVLATMTPNKVKFEEVAGTLREAFGVQRTKQIMPIMSGMNVVGTEFTQEVIFVRLIEKVQLILEREVDGGQVEMIKREDGFVVRFPEGALFGDKPEAPLKIQDHMGMILLQVINLLQSVPNEIVIKGHVDERSVDPTGPYPNAWALGAAEAAAVAEFFSQNANFGSRRIKVQSSGSSEPLAEGATKGGQGKNSRVEILVSKEIAALSESESAGGNPQPPPVGH